MPNAEPRTVFLTGATGFIGRHVLRRLAESGRNRILCLTRSSVSDGGGRQDNVEWVVGDIGHAASYAKRLARADVVIHLAAATGAASTTQLRDVNHGGTESHEGHQGCPEGRPDAANRPGEA
jgi:nucleoside-diphosphate-sugar epimerase